MKTPLDTGTEIILKESGTNNFFNFTITELVGTGSSCIVYTAVHKDGEGNTFSVRLKEFYPYDDGITRNGIALSISENSKARFNNMLRYFTSGYSKQLEFRNNSEQMNSISNIQGIYVGNNTKYIAMSCNAGSCLTSHDTFTLLEIMRIVRSVTRQISEFHKNGYLYLDLKPNNIFLYPETPDMVMMFDFDSVIKKEDVIKHSEWLSYTEGWSAPELEKNKYSAIDEKTDIYSIGALLLFLLFKRKPSPADKRRWATWNDSINNSILAAESPETIRIVTEIFRNTLTAIPSKRYKSCNEILEILDSYINKYLAPKPYLKTVLPVSSNYFCGRDREISEIHIILQNKENLLVLNGIGGIGKSELAKQYALKYSDSYDAVIFVRFENSIIETIADDRFFPIVNFNKEESETEEEYFYRKIKVLQEICTDRTLIILDNFDTEECDNIDELTSLDCKLLITSRIDFEDIFLQMNVDILDEFESLTDIFCHYSKHEADENIDNIIIAL